MIKSDKKIDEYVISSYSFIFKEEEDNKNLKKNDIKGKFVYSIAYDWRFAYTHLMKKTSCTPFA